MRSGRSPAMAGSEAAGTVEQVELVLFAAIDVEGFQPAKRSPATPVISPAATHPLWLEEKSGGTGTEGHALDPRINPSRTACPVWEITGLFKVGAIAVVAVSAMAAAKAQVVITVRMGHVRLGAAPKSG